MPAYAGRLTLLIVLAVVIGGCKIATFRVPGNNGGPDAGPAIEDPAEYFALNVEPIFADQCQGCHEGQQTGPGGEDVQFLEPGNYYASVRLFTSTLVPGPIIVPGEPQNSRLISYAEGGTHQGGPFDPGTVEPVQQWITLEGGGPIVDLDAGPPMMMEPVQTDPLTIVLGQTNRIPLDTGDVGLTGAFFVFEAQDSGTQLEMQAIRLEAGPRGISVTLPRLYIWGPDDMEGTADPQAMRFMQSNFQVEAAQSVELSPRQFLEDFPTGGKVSVEFTSVQFMM